MARLTTLRLVRPAPPQLRQLQLGRPTSPQWVRLTTQLRQLHRLLIDPHCVPVIALEAGVIAHLLPIPCVFIKGTPRSFVLGFYPVLSYVFVWSLSLCLYTARRNLG